MQLRQRPKLNFVVVAGGVFFFFFVVVLLLIADVNVFVVCCPGITACKFLGIMLLLNFWNCLRDKLKQKCVAVFGISFCLCCCCCCFCRHFPGSLRVELPFVNFYIKNLFKKF